MHSLEKSDSFSPIPPLDTQNVCVVTQTLTLNSRHQDHLLFLNLIHVKLEHNIKGSLKHSQLPRKLRNGTESDKKHLK